MESIKKGIHEFQRSVHPKHSDRFEALEKGQKPEILLITCSDSRIDPALVTQTLPGELFVLRNAGNLVPDFGAGPGAEAGTIEYAVAALGVKHIVVCGHSHCGAMAAVLDPDQASSLPAVKDWLALAGPERVRGDRSDLLSQIQLNVKTQLQRLRTHPSVRKAEEQGDLSLHGWIYHFESGRMDELDPATGEFAGLMEGATA